MRIVWVGVALLVAGVLGAVQVVATVVLRGDAQRGAWVGIVPEPLALRVERVDPALPLPPALRLVLARRALERGDTAAAEAYAERLPVSADRGALEGRLAEARGDGVAAARAYLAADDLDDIERLVDGYVREKRYDAALALQHEAITQLEADRTQTDELARAFYELGVLDEAHSYRLWIVSQRRRDAELQAAAAYARAVALAPLSERYLIAYGNQLLNVNRIGDAERAFRRARDVDPASAIPLVGLGEAAIRRSDRASARAYLERARAIDPGQPAVVRLAHELGV
jgi:tetratricopeptide (TPR) repeat protein